MYSRRWTAALLMMVLLAVPVGGANAQISTSGGAVVEVTIEPLRNGKPPQEVQCVEKVKVIKGTATIQTFTNQRKELQEGEEACITPSGQLTTSTASVQPGGNPPSTGGVTPPPTCVTGCNAAIQIR